MKVYKNVKEVRKLVQRMNDAYSLTLPSESEASRLMEDVIPAMEFILGITDSILYRVKVVYPIPIDEYSDKVLSAYKGWYAAGTDGKYRDNVLDVTLDNILAIVAAAKHDWVIEISQYEGNPPPIGE